MSQENDGDWLKDLERRLFEELDNTNDPTRAVCIIETICTGRTNIMNDGYDHDNSIPKDITDRIINSPSPVIAKCRARLASWGENPKDYDPLPTYEWFLEMIRYS